MESFGVSFVQEQAASVESAVKVDAETVSHLPLKVTGDGEPLGDREGVVIGEVDF